MTASNFKYDHLEKLKKRLFDKYDGYKLKDGWEVQYSQRSKPGARPDPYFYSPTCNKNNFSSLIINSYFLLSKNNFLFNLWIIFEAIRCNLILYFRVI